YDVLSLTLSLKADKKESFVMFDRPAQNPAVLVPPEGRQFRWIIRVPRIQSGITRKAENIPMEVIGARFDSGIHVAAGKSAITRSVILGLDLELSNRVDIEVR